MLLSLPLLVGQTPAGWRPFAPKDGSFSIVLPGAPTEKKQQLKAGAGAVDVSMYICEAAGDGTYVVAVTDYSSQEIQGGEEKRLRNARDGAVQNSEGKLIHERKISLAGHPGRELWIGTKDDGMIHTRLFAVKQRLYQTMAIGPKTFVETKETASFMDSFKLKK